MYESRGNVKGLRAQTVAALTAFRCSWPWKKSRLWRASHPASSSTKVGTMCLYGATMSFASLDTCESDQIVELRGKKSPRRQEVERCARKSTEKVQDVRLRASHWSFVTQLVAPYTLLREHFCTSVSRGRTFAFMSASTDLKESSLLLAALKRISCHHYIATAKVRNFGLS